MKRHEEFRNLRISMNATREEIAEVLDVSTNKVTLWESGRRTISNPIMKRMREMGKDSK